MNEMNQQKEEIKCPFCSAGGDKQEAMGHLGNRPCYRCRCCGMSFALQQGGSAEGEDDDDKALRRQAKQEENGEL